MKDKSIGNSEKSFDYYIKAAIAEIKLKNSEVNKNFKPLYKKTFGRLSTLGLAFSLFITTYYDIDFWLGLLFALVVSIFVIWLTFYVCILITAKNKDFRKLIDSYNKDY